MALSGEGQIVFVTGGPGRGKTALIQAFAKRAMEAHSDLLVASGNGNAYSGVGDPYLPFRSVLDMLSGDVEAQWAAGAIDRDHALRLWQGLPSTAQALVEVGSDLIDTFLAGRALVARAAACVDAKTFGTGWLNELEDLVARKATLPPDPNLSQSALFKQYTRVLSALAQQRPVLLLLDDLQWVDAGSASLLFHLGRELPRCRVMILGAYRPEELALRRAGERHPLEGVLAEFKRRYGDIWLDLSRTEASEARRFVEALLDSEPNRLGREFRDALFRRTEGHPLYTTELLRTLQERGGLVRGRDGDGAWVEGSALHWDELPSRVEAVIEERINRLEPGLREILTVASVEGEAFTAQVIARVQEADEREVVRQLSGALERRHRLVKAQGLRRLGKSSLSLHRFQHNLFQKCLYNSLNEAERGYLHQDVGEALEALYADHPQELAAITPHLARHFQEAGLTGKALDYLRRAGERATRLSASQEAVTHFTRALELLETLPDTPERSQTELALQLNLAVPLVPTKGWGAPEMAHVVARAQTLCAQVGEPSQQYGLLWFAQCYRLVLGEHPHALELAEQLRVLAEQFEDPGLIIVAYYGLASILIYMGEFASAKAHARRVIDLYDAEQHHILTSLIVGHDPGAQSLEISAQSTWILGYPDLARQRMREAEVLAQKLAHPHTLAWAHLYVGGLGHLCRDWQATQEGADKVLSLSSEHGYPITGAYAACMRGLALAKQGQVVDGIAQVQRGISDWQATGMRTPWSQLAAWLAEAYLMGGRTKDALDTTQEALDYVAASQEGFWEAELHRLSGEAWLARGDKVRAESSFRKAIDVARKQSAKSFELRATMSLARLGQGKGHEAREMLAEIYGWFTEGFDTGDLQEAKALLEELSRFG
jgi:tetratricopeptide (TPR) repeat protein